MLSGRTCIITGSSSGLGKALAIELAKHQANLILFSRNEAALKEVADECTTLGAQCIVVVGDVTHPDDCLRLIEETISHFKTIDYLINNAGLSMWAEFSNMTDLSAFKELMAVNYYGAMYCSYYALPYLKQSKGLIVAISSVQGKYGVPYHTGYSAAKHALEGFFKALRMELQGSGVDILLVEPAWIKGTQLRAHAITDASEEHVFRKRSSDQGIELSECSQKILIAMQRRLRELMLPRRARLMDLIYPFFPKYVDRVIARKVKKEV